LSEAVVQRTEKGPVARSATPQASAGGPPEAVCGGHFPSVFAALRPLLSSWPFLLSGFEFSASRRGACSRLQL